METIVIKSQVDLHYSPDDMAWYFQHYGIPNKVSQSFKTKAKALLTWEEHKIKWHKL